MNAAMDLIDAARHTFSRKPLINDEKHWERNWKRREGSAVRELGTIRQALRTLAQLESLIGGGLCTRLFAHICSDESLHAAISSLTESLCTLEDKASHSVVGDPKHVAFIIPPALHIGFAVSRSLTSPFTHELIEGRYYTLEVLRKNAKIIAIRWRHVARMESYGNRHVM